MIVLVMILVLGLPGTKATAALPRHGSSGSQPLCEILSRAAQHDNSMVTVDGIYVQLSHGAVLTAATCAVSPRPSVNVRLADNFHQKNRVMKTLWALTRARKPVKVVMRGMFHVAKKEQGFGQGVEPYEIEVVEFLSAEPYVEQNGTKPPA